MPKTIFIKRTRAPRNTQHAGTVKSKAAFKEDSSFGSDRQFFAWGKVEKAHSKDHSADVILDSGMKLTHVSVVSRSWAGTNATRGFGERDLPPEGSIVLIVYPYGTTDDAVILGSVFSVLGKQETILKWKAELLDTGKERERVRINEAGWKETYNKDTEDYELVSSDAKFKAEIAATTKATKLTINGAVVEINSLGGVKITPATGQAITLNNGSTGANDFPNCLFTGAPHCLDALQTVKVP